MILAILKLLCLMMFTVGLNQLFLETGSNYKNTNQVRMDSVIMVRMDSVIMTYRK